MGPLFFLRRSEGSPQAATPTIMIRKITTPFALAGFAAVLAVGAGAAPAVFDFEDPQGINQVRFSLEAPVEPAVGTAGGVRGTIRFDPEDPAALTGRISVDAATLSLANKRLQESVHSAKGIDVARYPEIAFEALRASGVRREGGDTWVDVTGIFTLRGISKEMTVPVQLTLMPDALERRRPGVAGDLLVVRATFTITREEFKVRPGEYLDKLSDAIEVTVSIAGAAPR